MMQMQQMQPQTQMQPQPQMQQPQMQLQQQQMQPQQLQQQQMQSMQALQNSEISADTNFSELQLGSGADPSSVKTHLTSDLDQCINQLTNAKNNVSVLPDNVSWRQYKQKEVNNLSRLNTKSEKAIVSAIGGYNFAQRQLDRMSFKSRSMKSKNEPCGSITCKQRGAKIKAALINLASFSPESLGSLGVTTAISNAYDWTAKGVGLRTKQTPGQTQQFQLQPQPPATRSWSLFGRKGGRTRRRRR